MGDLTLHDYKGLSEEELSRLFEDERRKMFGADAPENCFSGGPITIYSRHNHNSEE